MAARAHRRVAASVGALVCAGVAGVFISVLVMGLAYVFVAIIQPLEFGAIPYLTWPGLEHGIAALALLAAAVVSSLLVFVLPIVVAVAAWREPDRWAPWAFLGSGGGRHEDARKPSDEQEQTSSQFILATFMASREIRGFSANDPRDECQHIDLSRVRRRLSEMSGSES